jgi:hypothetical protein
MLCDIEVQDTPTVVTDDEKTIERAEGDRRNREEVHRGNRFPVITNHCYPAAQTGPTVSNPPLIPPSVSASRLCVHPFDPLSAPCGCHEWIRKVLCFPRNLVAPELHDAHGVGRLAVICQDEFGDPKITAANDSSDGKPLFARLTSALVLYVASTPGSLA